jgi:hypothetical protein
VWLLNYRITVCKTWLPQKKCASGIACGCEHRVPKLEYLLGMVLLQADYAEAAQHFRAFQHLSTKPADTAEAQRQLDEITRLSAAAPLSASERK